MKTQLLRRAWPLLSAGIKALTAVMLAWGFAATMSFLVSSADAITVVEDWRATHDYLGGSDRLTAMTRDSQGSFYITGVSDIPPYFVCTVKLDGDGRALWDRRWTGRLAGANLGNPLIAVDGSQNAYVCLAGEDGIYYTIIKYNESGEEEWVRYCGDPVFGGATPKAIALDPSGNLYVTGHWGGHYYLRGQTDVVTVKYDPAGNQLWLQKFATYSGADGQIYQDPDPDTVPGNYDNDQGNAMDVAPDGSVYVVGMIDPRTSSHDTQMLILKYSPGGTQEWTRIYGNPLNTMDAARRVKVEPAGNIFVAGESDWGYPTVLKYDSDGTLLWVHQEPKRVEGYIIDETIAVDAHGDAILAMPAPDFSALKLDGRTGTPQWTWQLPEGINPTAVSCDLAGSVYVTGWDGVGYANLRAATAKIDANGLQVWSAFVGELGPYSNAEAIGVVVDDEGNVFVAGKVSTPTVKPDYFLVKYVERALDSDGDGMPDEWEIAHGLDPNDANDAAEDPDRDGISNVDEFIGSTDPNESDTPIADPVTTLLYRKGDPVPGEPAGTTFVSFGLPVLDGERVGFHATIKASPTAKAAQQVIFGGEPARVLLRQWGLVPGVNGAAFSAFSNPVFGGGNYAFIGTLKPGSGGVSVADNTGVWSSASGAPTLIARKGQEAPGAGGGVWKMFTTLALPESSGALFVAQLRTGTAAVPAPGNVTTANDVGLWREVGGAAQKVLREGDELADDAGTVRKVKTFTVFKSADGKPVAGSPSQRRSYCGDGTVLVLAKFVDGTQAVLEAPGDGAPMMIEAQTADPVNGLASVFGTLGVPAANSSGEAFHGTLKTGAAVNARNDQAIFTGNGVNGFDAFVREGDVAPGTGGATFGAASTSTSPFRAPLHSGLDGHVVFHGTLKPGSGTPPVGGATDTGLWTDAGGVLHLIAREGDPAPGCPGAVFAAFGRMAVDPDASPLRNLAFIATLRNAAGALPVPLAAATGLWARDKSDQLHLLRRLGESVDLSGTAAPVTLIDALLPPATSPGDGRATNHAGQIVYRATLGGIGQAIFQVQMP